MVEKLVSVVIPAFNRETTIIRAIESVLSQSYSNLECIIVDDCSTDNTVDIVNTTYANNERVTCYKLPHNSGACVARNKGVEIAKGEYVAFLDSDDVYKTEKIEKQIAALLSSGADFCATGFEYVAGEDCSIVLPYKGNKEDILKQLLYLNCITTGVLCGRRSCLLETPFDVNQPRYQDWDIALRLFKKYSFVFIDDVTLELISNPVSISSSTSHSKTLNALKMLYKKNEDDYKKDKRAYSQIHWLMGLHSMYVPGQRNYMDLWIGVTSNGLSFHRLWIFIAMLLGFKNIFQNKVQHI